MRQPQTTRQQFAACGACRARRIRCDLKDICEDALLAGKTPCCSTCRERNLFCAYEFTEMKAAKILRRGRRIKEVEAMYGRRDSQSPTDEETPPSPFYSAIPHASTGAGSIIPTLDPKFFNSSFWKNFHVQRPILEPQEFPSRYRAYVSNPNSSQTSNSQPFTPAAQLIASVLVIWASSFGLDESGSESISLSVGRTTEMVRDALLRVDRLGLLRKPSWDGVRALLLLWPLTHDVLERDERQVMHESTLSQVCTLCTMGSGGGIGMYADPAVRTRIFWYAHSLESVTFGLKGGRILLSDDDLSLFLHKALPSESAADQQARILLSISTACRSVHSLLVGMKKGTGTASVVSLNAVFETLEKAWLNLDRLREAGGDESDWFASKWQILIFECYCSMRNSFRNMQSQQQYSPSGSQDFFEVVTRKCLALLPHLLQLVRRLVPLGFFAFDTGLMLNGVAGAAFLLARGGARWDPDTNASLEMLRGALGQMRWAFSARKEAEEKLRAVWSQGQTTDATDSPISPGYSHSSEGSSPSGSVNTAYSHQNAGGGDVHQQYLITPPRTPTHQAYVPEASYMTPVHSSGAYTPPDVGMYARGSRSSPPQYYAGANTTTGNANNFSTSTGLGYSSPSAQMNTWQPQLNTGMQGPSPNSISAAVYIPSYNGMPTSPTLASPSVSSDFGERSHIWTSYDQYGRNTHGGN